jgi:phage tail sheath protein FI
VLCDETNNPPSSVDEGKLIVEIGIAPVKPAEFVVFRISQWQGGADTSE